MAPGESAVDRKAAKTGRRGTKWKGAAKVATPPTPSTLQLCTKKPEEGTAQISKETEGNPPETAIIEAARIGAEIDSTPQIPQRNQ